MRIIEYIVLAPFIILITTISLELLREVIDRFIYSKNRQCQCENNNAKPFNKDPVPINKRQHTHLFNQKLESIINESH